MKVIDKNNDKQIQFDEFVDMIKNAETYCKNYDKKKLRQEQKRNRSKEIIERILHENRNVKQNFVYKPNEV